MSKSKPRHGFNPHLSEIRILSSVFRLLPQPPIYPSLPRNQPCIAQNKPNSIKAKINATSYAPKSYTNIPPHPAPKNKPND